MMRIHWTKKVASIVVVSIAILLLTGTLVVLEKTGKTHLFHKKPIPPISAGQNTKGEVAGSQTAGKDTSTTGDLSGNAGAQKGIGNGQASTADAPKQPSGDFVSNHRPNLGGSPAPNIISSVCTTTPGASCSIMFTKDGLTRSLLAQTADSNGSTYWDWKLQDIGLTAGTWRIKATATLNGKSVSTDDAQDMVVSP